MLYEAGTRFDGPDGQYYILTRDIEAGDVLSSSDFSAHNGAPDLKFGEVLPYWFLKVIYKLGEGG